MKKWYQSKTIWANIIMAALAVAGELSNVSPISQNPKIWVSVTAVLNIVLRLITTQQIGTEK